MTLKRVNLLNCDAALPARAAVHLRGTSACTRSTTPSPPRAARTPDADFLFTEAVTARGLRHRRRRDRRGARPRAEVERLRAAYAAAGYGHGHRVGLLLENRPAFLFHWFALNALGVSVVPINAEMRSAELELPDRPQRDRPGGHAAASAPTTARAPQRRPACRFATIGPVTRRRCRRADRGAARGAAPSATAANARCSTPRAPPAGPRAACSSNAYFLRAGEWYAGLGGALHRAAATRSASSRRCR